nr:immunoglobulin light chain junction region [Macaca mulatta]MOX77448.1 immunoglobulin light chain junction region [Macaca mulatta]MOX79669.1 immunoglobulin light chain junction region [Macaca mulatta]MOX81346.1 immunoglobulin light chain junction region [Macaca mulatta]MOX82911.1 immunoglobulin light chain junction region [Macaca mulatta]
DYYCYSTDSSGYHGVF